MLLFTESYPDKMRHYQSINQSINQPINQSTLFRNITSCATNVECITVLQKRVVRLIFGARRLDHTNPLFKQLGILKFVDLVKFKTSIIMFKAYHNVLPDSLQKNV